MMLDVPEDAVAVVRAGGWGVEVIVASVQGTEKGYQCGEEGIKGKRRRIGGSARLVQGERNLRLRLPVPTHTGNI